MAKAVSGWKPAYFAKGSAFPLSQSEARYRNQIVSGLPELERVFREFKLSGANRIARPAINKAASLGAKYVKTQIPSRYKTVRKAIGWRSVKTKFNSGIVGAKVGAAVGKHRKAQLKERNGRKGVGIDIGNIHWWFLGTEDRYTGQRRIKTRTGVRIVKTGNKKRYTGKMKPQTEPMEKLLAGAKGSLRQAIIDTLKKSIPRELERIRKKSLGK